MGGRSENLGFFLEVILSVLFFSSTSSIRSTWTIVVESLRRCLLSRRYAIYAVSTEEYS